MLHNHLLLVRDWPMFSRLFTPLSMMNFGLVGYHAKHPLVRRLLHGERADRQDAGDPAMPPCTPLVHQLHLGGLNLHDLR